MCCALKVPPRTTAATTGNRGNPDSWQLVSPVGPTTGPAGFDQVGCIYTAQGFEYDWNGVIFGPDLVWRGDQWVADRTSSEDSVVTRAGQDDYDRLIRDTYKVLLTRGMVGTLVYSTDPETQRKLRELVRN